MPFSKFDWPAMAGALALIAVSGPASAAPDDTLGVAIMSASVISSGSLHHGSGVTAVQKTGTGVYEVTFDRSITSCTCVANLGGVAGDVSYFSGWHINANCPPFSLGPIKTQVAEVSTTRDLLNSYASADADFHLIVFCPR